ncbi:uncharacterized protein KY384_001681 [Bacidia gigantensis]|uniref:uncharacterized protein n=1 Tax=Bacidia gigantensis TaxID=2732470 RepID=UPI001D052C44|nr:uncharacterized protein KY384_001681 [Bacidia gigantensis]KAG8533940.1 hypothetical protein KY384_001681 [Bacidia gigantensis]
MPILTGVLGIVLFMKSFYSVKLNKIGITEKKSYAPYLPLAMRRKPARDSAQTQLTLANQNPASVSALTLAVPGTPQMFLPHTPGAQTPGSEMPANPLDIAAPAKRRTVLIATMEYDIEDWGIKIKIGGLGVMANLMSKNLAHQDIIWVIPCVGGVEYPIDCPGESIIIAVLDNLYEVKIQYHTLKNITYVLLDAPIFRQQTKQDPYPPRMDDLDSACYYSAWNSCIAEMMRRFPIDLYHINDYHGAVAPLHLLPKIVPCVLSLHNAEFQGLWPMRTEQESLEVCNVFDLDPHVVSKYVQFGEVFNLLHAGASYLRVHQKGFGAVGVSGKYGKRAFARYPILWGMSDVGALPNPDPTDTAPWNKEQVRTSDIHVDQELEAAKPALKLEAQKWAKLKEDPEADLFVFVGRWSMQKGVDSIADVFPSILEQNEHVQLICIGPVIDLYGAFAALKLGRMMEVYPGRVFSKPEFTQLPPCIFSGADFALMPSRDEPFGLVAVEFGRKGALCVGARVGGLGHMPGWWFTIESTTTKHFMQQFKTAIQGALASKPDTRAIMRARAAKQRFPVAQWVEDLEKLQNKAINISDKRRVKSSRQSVASFVSTNNTPVQTRKPTPTQTCHATPAHSRNVSRAASPERDDILPALPNGGLGSRLGPGNKRNRLKKKNPNGTSSSNVSEEESGYESGEDTQRGRGRQRKRFSRSQLPSSMANPTTAAEAPSTDANWPFTNSFPVHSSLEPLPAHMPGDSTTASATAVNTRNVSMLSLPDIVGDRKDYNLQNVSPFFTDPKKEFTDIFRQKLEKLDGKTSEDALCIEEYLTKSEKKWFGMLRAAELGSKTPSRKPSPAPSKFNSKRNSANPAQLADPEKQQVETSSQGTPSQSKDDPFDEFLLGDNYKPPTGLKHILRVKIGDWPIYSILLALGQILAANSYQITLLTGSVGQPASKLYTVASIYLASSILWWLLYRRFATLYVLSAPFILYGFAFLLIGVAPLGPSFNARGWIQNVATGLYAVASSSGSIYFAVNFGDEGGAPVTAWTYRACVIQGTQQIYVVALWFWGSQLTKSTAAGQMGKTGASANKLVIIPVGVALACLMWAIGVILFIGLPKYYRQAPGNIPSFYSSLFKRKIIGVLGSVATILARATSPNKIGPGDVFPDFSSDIGDGLGKAWFWVGLGSQLIIPVGFFWWFRKEQLSKP